ncbi:MAG: hypothetical protein MJ067_06525, partial [Oscillospiraceae bacterium]|nr:hypothetical protein [Oscillospiraceae bacterium]
MEKLNQIFKGEANTVCSLSERKLHEECGVFGIYSGERRDVASLCYYGLFALQHRGQESAGICVNDDGVFNTHREVGLVNDFEL